MKYTLMSMVSTLSTLAFILKPRNLILLIMMKMLEMASTGAGILETRAIEMGHKYKSSNLHCIIHR